MTIVKASTKKGQNLIWTSKQNIGKELWQVYDRYSRDKEDAWNWCFDRYSADPKSYNFHICSRNSYQFTVSWNTEIDGKRAIIVITKDNNYCII